MVENQLYESNAKTYGYYAKISAAFPDRTVKRNEIQKGEYMEPQRARGVFEGWYTDAACTDGHEYDLNTEEPLTEDITLYAKWGMPDATLISTGTGASAFRGRLNTLVGGYANMTRFVRAEDEPDLTTMKFENLISNVGVSDEPIYAWNEDGTVYWWSNAERIHAPSNMNSYFDNFTALSGWDTGNVTDLSYLFTGCTSLTHLNGLENWNTGAVKTLSYAFNGCAKLTDATSLKNWDFTSLTDASYMFTGCKALPVITLEWHSASPVNAMHAFEDCSALKTVELDMDGTTLSDASCMFKECGSLISPVITGLAVSGSMSQMFYNCTSLQSLEGIADWDTAAATNFAYLFDNCKSLTQLSGLENWNTGANKTLAHAFQGCAALTDITALAGWDTAAVTDMSYLFTGCSALTQLNSLENWNTGANKNLAYAF